MKVRSFNDGQRATVAFAPENEEEQRLIVQLRNHFFYGVEENGTYPQYDGVITSDDNKITVLKMKYTLF